MPAAARIEWAFGGDRLLTCIGGTLRVHGVDASSRIVDGPDLLDARWRGDAIIAVHRNGAIQCHRDGTVEILGESRRLANLAAIADVDQAVMAGDYLLSIESFAGLTSRNLAEHMPTGQITSIAISPDGKLVAAGYENAGGRGWLVIEVARSRVLDRSWTPTRRSIAPLALAFDGTSKRLAIASPEAGPGIGAIRIGRDEKYPRGHLGGARAVALDDRGVLAAYAYPPGLGERRLRVDYLEPGAKGGSAIAIGETLWIEPGLADIVALAFDPHSRRIACVDSHANIDVVPVP